MVCPLKDKRNTVASAFPSFVLGLKYLNDVALQYVSEFKYLGHTV